VLELEEGLPSEHDRRGPWVVAERRAFLGRALMAQGKFDEALEFLAGSYPVFQKYFGDNDKRTREVRERLHELYEATGDKEKAALYESPPQRHPPRLSRSFRSEPASEAVLLSRGSS